MAATDPPPATSDPADVVQMNVRIPRALRDQIDARRATKGLSRDKWVARAIQYALANTPATRPLRSGPVRTAPPPQHR